MRAILYFNLFWALLISNSSVVCQNQVIKSIRTESYTLNTNHDYLDSVYFNGDTAFILESIEYFNELGKPLSRIEYYSNGKKNREAQNEYDTKERLKKLINIEYYGTGDRVEMHYHYEENDSLSKIEIFDDGEFFKLIEFNRNSTGILLSQSTLFEGKKRNETTFEYDQSGKLLTIKKFMDSTQYAYLEKKYDDQGKLIEEIRFGEDLGWYCNDTCHNFYFYNPSGNLELAKYWWENDSNYTEHSMTYHLNGQLKEIRRIGKGCIRCTLAIDKYDEYGNLVSREYIRESENYKRGWYYHYEYDSKGNWIFKTETNANGLRSLTKRVIEYY